MSIIGIILVLLVVGFVFWIIQSAPIPINPWFKTVIMGLCGHCDRPDEAPLTPLCDFRKVTERKRKPKWYDWD